MLLLVKDSSLISNTLRILDSSLTANGFIANNDTQIFIESFVQDEFVSSTNVKSNYVASVDISIVGDTVSKCVNSKLYILNTYIDSLYESAEHDANNKPMSNKITGCLTHELLSKVGKQFILSTCIHHFLILLTYKKTEYDNSN